jgi:hypothetical protein
MPPTILCPFGLNYPTYRAQDEFKKEEGIFNLFPEIFPRKIY